MTGIVVGVDDSEEAAAAFAWAVGYAEDAGIPLTVMTVVDHLELTALWTDRPEDNVADRHVEAARLAVGHLIARLEADRRHDITVPVEVKVSVGHAVKDLTETAKDAQMLVVGSRGAGGFGRLLLGSVSNAVVHHAKCPVVVVPLPDTRS